MFFESRDVDLRFGRDAGSPRVHVHLDEQRSHLVCKASTHYPRNTYPGQREPDQHGVEPNVASIFHLIIIIITNIISFIIVIIVITARNYLKHFKLTFSLVLFLPQCRSWRRHRVILMNLLHVICVEFGSSYPRRAIPYTLYGFAWRRDCLQDAGVAASARHVKLGTLYS